MDREPSDPADPTEPADPEPPPPPPSDPGEPDGPETPSNEPPTPTTPDPGHKTPESGPGGPAPTPESPDGRDRAARTGRPRAAKTGGAGQAGWRYWWEFNRESIIGVRHLLRRRATITGVGTVRATDVLGEHRGAVLQALRALAVDPRAERDLRGAALVALGRTGAGGDADLMVRILRDRREPQEVQTSAALSLGLLRKIDEGATRDGVRAAFGDLLANRRALPAPARDVLVVSAGLRARDDKSILIHLAERMAAGPRSGDEAAALAVACGIAGDPMTIPELLDATESAQLSKQRLNDTVRAHATGALGRAGDPAATATLLRVLRSRRAGQHTKRSAVLALGRMLREGNVAERQLPKVRLALLRTLKDRGDTVLRGFAALALARAEEPQGVAECLRAVDGGRAELRPYAALALGLAARSGKLDDGKTRHIRTFLARKLSRSSDGDLSSALSIALGLAEAREALPDLLDRVQSNSLPAAVRGAAANGAGLLGMGSARAEKVLRTALKEGPSELVAEAALGLGLLGGRSVVTVLLEMLPDARSSLARGRIVRALGYLGHSGAVAPLLKILRDRSAKATLREQAAIALGLLGDGREVDALFELGFDFNFYATTPGTFELLDLM